MGVLYITSQKQNSGKTTLSAALASLLIDSGKVVDVVKPFSENGTLEEGDRSNFAKLLDKDYSLQNEESLEFFAQNMIILPYKQMPPYHLVFLHQSRTLDIAMAF